MSEASRRWLPWAGLLVGLLSRTAVAQSAPAEAAKPAAPSSSPRSANDPKLELPPAPEGTTDLRLNEIYKRPFGDLGLEFSEKALSLKGSRIRIPGYMVKRCSHVPGRFLLTALPTTLHDEEMGPCDDLPAETVWVTVPAPTPLAALHGIVPYTPGMLLLSGTLRLGARNEPDGRISWIRLELDAPPPDRAATAPKEGATPKADADRKPPAPTAEAPGGAPPAEAATPKRSPQQALAAAAGAAPPSSATKNDEATQTPKGGDR